jgi:citrate synthase
MTDSQYLTARQAAAALGISIDTLYAYVSRGMLRSEPAPGLTRARRYFRDDIERLNERKELRREPEKASARSLHWGSPVLESSLTLIHDGHVYYRGRDAIDLARSESVERVASLLWTGALDRADQIFRETHIPDPQTLARLMNGIPTLGPVERCQVALAGAGFGDPSAYDLRPGSVALAGARIVKLMASVISGRAPAATIDVTLGQAWTPRRASATSAIRSALILCADHELNASAFTARCAASAQASVYDVVAAGLSALKGRLHGGYTARVEALLDETASAGGAQQVVAARLRCGEELPGFGHRLYPDGDPRARMLLSLAESAGIAAAAKLAYALSEAGQALTGQHPTLDFGLAALTRALRLPRGSALALFALGRTIGWIAHAIEQYTSNELIRPRARYIGPFVVPPSGPEQHQKPA